MQKLCKFSLLEQGASLIELVLAVIIVGFIVFIIISLPNSINLVGKSHYVSLAKDIASQNMESIRAKTYANLADGASPISDSRLADLPSASGTITISACPSSICKNGEQTKEVDIEVNWLEGSVNKKALLSTFVSEGGLK